MKPERLHAVKFKEKLLSGFLGFRSCILTFDSALHYAGEAFVPGAYTAIVSGVGGGIGVGLVEAFEMD